MKPALNQLRDKIRDIDQQILQLVSERLRIAEEIGRVKKEAGLPLRNWEQEKMVLERGRKQSLELELPENLVKKLLNLLIEESRIRQEQLHYSGYTGQHERILIVGGMGEMGTWFAHFFHNQGHQVLIYDTRGKSPHFTSYGDLSLALKDSTCTMIATNLDVVPELIEQITELDYRGLLFDIASFKGFLKPSIEKALEKGVRYTSVHPMFGARVRTLSDKVICICDCGDSEATRQVTSFFSDTAATLFNINLEEHDRLVSYILGASHLLNILFAHVLRKSGFTFSAFNDIGSTTFNSQIETTRSVIFEKPDLYYSIQRVNPFKEQLFDLFLEGFHEIISWIKTGQSEEFIADITNSRNWLDGK